MTITELKEGDIIPYGLSRFRSISNSLWFFRFAVWPKRIDVRLAWGNRQPHIPRLMWWGIEHAGDVEWCTRWPLPCFACRRYKTVLPLDHTDKVFAKRVLSGPRAFSEVNPFQEVLRRKYKSYLKRV